MTTAEKLVVQLFERKRSIIQQVKQQIDLYEQHFVSNLLIQGINPPPWFLNPNLKSISSDPREPNKEELIADLLLSHGGPTFPYSIGQRYLHNKLVVTGDNGELLDGLPKDIQDSNKNLDAGYESRPVHEVHANDISYTSNRVSERAYMSAHDQMDVRNSNLSIKSGQSSGQSQMSQPVVKQNSGKILDIPLMVVHASSKGLDGGIEQMTVPKSSPLDQTDMRISRTSMVPDQSLNKFQRSKSRQKALELRTSEKAAAKSRSSHELETISFSGVALYGIDSEEPDHCKDLLIMAKSCDIDRGFMERDAYGGDLRNKNGTNDNCGRITRSKSACLQASPVNESFKVDGSRKMESKDSVNEGCMTKESKGLDPELDNGTSSYSGEIKRNKSSCMQHSSPDESLGVDRSFVMECKDEFKLAQSMDNGNRHISKAMELVIPFGVDRENSGVQEAAIGKFEVMEQRSSMYLGRMTRSRRSSQQPSSVNDSVGVVVSSYSPKVDGSTHYEKTGKLSQKIYKANGVLEGVKALTGLYGNIRRARKISGSEELNIESSSIPDLKVPHSGSDATVEYPLVSPSNRSNGKALSDSPLIQPLPSTSAVLNQVEEVPSATTTELSGHHPCFGSTLDCVILRTESEGLAVRYHSDAHIDVKPNQLDFGSMEDCSLSENISVPSIKRSLEKSSERICSMKAAASLEKSTSDYPPKASIGMGQSEASRETAKAQRVFEANTEECNLNEKSTLEPYMNEKLKVTYAEDDSEAVACIRNSLGEKDASSLDFDNSSNPTMHRPDCHLMEGCPVLFMDEDHLSFDRLNKREIIPLTLQQRNSGSRSVSSLIDVATGDLNNYLNKEVDEANPPGQVLDSRENCTVDDENNTLLLENKFNCENIEKMCLMEDGGLNTSCSFEYPQGEDKISCSLEFKETQPTYISSLPENGSIYVKGDSRSPSKRRKIEDQQTNCSYVSPSFRVHKICNNIRGAHINSYVKSIENKLDDVSEFQSLSFSYEQNARESSNIFDEKIECHLRVETFSSPSLKIQQEEGEHGFQERIKVKMTPSTSEHTDLEPYSVSSLSKLARDSQGFFVEDDTTAYPNGDILTTKNLSNEQEIQKFFHVNNVYDQANAELLTFTGSGLLHRNSNLLGSSPVASPCSNDLAFDQYFPVYEGFVLNKHSENERLDTSIGVINFSKLNTKRTSSQRASIRKQIFRTASMCTTRPHFSSTYKSLKNKDLYLSIPDRLLEHTDMTSTLSFSDDAGNHTSADEVDYALQEVVYSDSLPYSGAHYGWNSKNYDTPAGKYSARISSRSFSSENQLSFNPELTCFPIEEEPSIDDQIENANKDNDDVQEDEHLTESNSFGNGEPHLETAEIIPNPPVADKFRNTGGVLDFTSVEVLSSVKERHNRRSNKRSTKRGKDNQMSTVGANSSRKASESLLNRFGMTKLSGAASQKRGVQRLSEKVKRNNIVSNVTSFIPLVQQKQAAAVCKGKRDIKVRALEAAEAAKRLEEKKENERKIKKEALKLERAKIEQETQRQRELDKKKKELKKKDAEIAARKRVREGEERKEKERKRMHIGVGCQIQRVEDEKVFAGKGGKEKHCGNKGNKMNNEKKSYNITGTEQDLNKENGDVYSSNNPENKFKTTGLLLGNIQQVSIVPGNFDAFTDYDGTRESTNMLDQSQSRSGVATKTSHEKSYDISPYQHSEDEEEVYELPTKKFIPSWASKNCVALALSSQQKVAPCGIFPRESFCSIDKGSKVCGDEDD